LSGLPLPATLLTAADDPIIPVRDFRRLRLPSSARLVICRHGGHNGFLEGIRLQSRYELDLPDWFDTLIPGPAGSF
jgi:predicted alpha/beta-fold hydrolase